MPQRRQSPKPEAQSLLLRRLPSRELLEFALDRVRRRLAVDDEQAIAKRDRAAGFERQRELRLAAVGEPGLPDWIRGKETIPARVPAGRESRVVPVVEDRE